MDEKTDILASLLAGLVEGTAQADEVRVAIGELHPSDIAEMLDELPEDSKATLILVS